MPSFLEYALEQYPEGENNPSDTVFVLPSKRAGYFLKNLMAKRAKKTLIAPEILSIEDFIARISETRLASESELIFKLYSVYLDHEKMEKESFESFAKWGMMLLQDFNEIDRYLIDSSLLFSTLSNLQQIRNWNPDGGSTPLIEKRLSFWRNLDPLYNNYRKLLLSSGTGYQGMLYRKAAEQAEHYCNKSHGKRHIFIGFNAMNTAETQIIRTFLGAGLGEIIWDADSEYIESNFHEAGYYMRKHLKQWPELNGILKGATAHFNQEKKISIVGIPKNVAQAKYCGSILDNLVKENPNSLSNTALILGNEALLNPILHSLPQSISAANVTMGYPLQLSTASQLFTCLLEQAKQKTDRGWYIRNILEILNLPFIQPLFRKESFSAHKGKVYLLRENILFANEEILNRIGLSDVLRELIFPLESETPKTILIRFRKLTQRLREILKEENDRVSIEALFRLDQLFSQLGLLCDQYPFVNSLKALEILFLELLSKEKLDFEGEPLRGLQIMGMLESRNLDFDTVIITSLNEGILPSGKSNNSFIPYDVKKEFGLPTYKEKDSVYAYHFYRLLQRAKKIYLIYNTEPDVLEGGEASRFINQLRTHPKLRHYIQDSIAAPTVKPSTFRTTIIPKDDALLNKLLELANIGFSPTSLSRFIENPILFYQRYILGIKEPPKLEESVAANTFGSILHKVLEVIYRPWIGSELTRGKLEKAKEMVPELAMKYFQKCYLKNTEARGRNIIALQVIIHYIITFLNQELEAIKNHTIHIIAVEKELIETLSIPELGLQVNLKGTIDRIQMVDGQIQIIDFKSGMVQATNLRINSWDDILTNPDKSKAMQLLCYAWLYFKSNNNQTVKAGVVSFKNLNSGILWFGLKTGSRQQEEQINSDTIAAFQAELISLFKTLFNPELPFKAPEPDEVI